MAVRKWPNSWIIIKYVIVKNGTNEAVNIEIIPNKYINGLISKYL